MIEADHAREACDLLGTAIASIIEDVHPVTLEFHVEGDESRLHLLEKAGRDVTTLAAAIRVLSRLSESSNGST